jgi:hypothetical protein
VTPTAVQASNQANFRGSVAPLPSGWSPAFGSVLRAVPATARAGVVHRGSGHPFGFRAVVGGNKRNQSHQRRWPRTNPWPPGRSCCPPSCPDRCRLGGLRRPRCCRPRLPTLLQASIVAALWGTTSTGPFGRQTQTHFLRRCTGQPGASEVGRLNGCSLVGQAFIVRHSAHLAGCAIPERLSCDISERLTLCAAWRSDVTPASSC